MKFTQKSKYFVYGVIATAVLVPLGTYAIKTIPLTFAEGDVMSASVLNSLMSRIESATSPLTADDFVGTWTLTQIVPVFGEPSNPSCTSSGINLSDECSIKDTTVSQDQRSRSREDTVVITKNSSNNVSFSQTKYASFYEDENGPRPSIGNISILSEYVLVNNGMYSTLFDVKKKGDTITLINKITSSTTSIISKKNTTGVVGNETSSTFYLAQSFNIIRLVRKNSPPAPANSVNATVSGTSIALAWTDQSIDETGFKVQYKTSVKGSWTTSATASANATTYTITGLTAGTYWIRVIATNTYGDAISSSEIQAVLQ
jgi:hypothetical protein